MARDNDDLFRYIIGNKEKRRYFGNTQCEFSQRRLSV